MVYRVQNGEVVFNQGECVGTRLYEAAGCEYVHLAIEPGGAVPEHSLPLAVSFCVLKGEGRCTVGEEEFTASAGEMLECPPGIMRGWRNESGEQLAVLVIKRAAAVTAN